MTIKPIYICPAKSLGSTPVWEALARLVPVHFHQDGSKWREAAAVIFLQSDEKLLESVLAAGVPCFVVHSDQKVPRQGDAYGSVTFGSAEYLDKRLRGRTIPHAALESECRILRQSDDEILAEFNGFPAWIRRRRGCSQIEIGAYDLPVLSAGLQVLDFLHGSHYLQLLPLLHFLRKVTMGHGWVAPSLKACFMFDDPNLHWKSYGFIPYPEILAEAKAHNYHVAFATVPLDAWWTHRATADLFKNNSAQLSLLIHGNNHTHAELATPRSDEAHLQLMAQGLRRISQLEQRVGVSVARAMAPPHGAYSEGAMSAMLALGYEGSCISPWSLRNWTPDREWAPSFGLEIAERLNSDFPVIPRFRLSPSCHGQIVISAFLDRPIIPVGHHDTMLEGLDLLRDLAALINSFDDVTWQNPQKILRANFHLYHSDGLLSVQPYSVRFSVRIQADTHSLKLVLPPENFGRGNNPYKLLHTSGSRCFERLLIPGENLAVKEGDEVEFTHPLWATSDFRSVRSPGSSIWASTRRILCEVRDRCAPIIRRKRVSRRSNA